MEVLEHFYNKVIIPVWIGAFDISITNLVISMLGGAAIFIILLLLFVCKPSVVPSKRQVIAELLINFIRRNICYNMIGPKEADRWVPLITSVFIFVLANNLVGLIPGAYAPTANPIVPITLAILVFFIVQITNIYKNGFKGYLRTYAPASVPKWMYIIVVPIEFISTIAKPFSLFIRLMANILAGNTIIFVVLSLIIYFKNYFIAIAAVPFAVIMTLLEIIISTIQAYIFAILSALYIGEAVKAKH